MSKIAAVEVIPVAAPGQATNDLDGTADTVIVKIFDDDGRYGFGEADAPPAAVKSFLEMPTAHMWSRNATEILIGEDPLEIAAIWQKLYDGTFWPGRRGPRHPRDLGNRHRAARPCRQAARHARVQADGRRAARQAQALLHHLPGPRDRAAASRDLMREIGRQFDAALASGFRAVKMEVLFYDLVTDRRAGRPDSMRAAGCSATTY